MMNGLFWSLSIVLVTLAVTSASAATITFENVAPSRRPGQRECGGFASCGDAKMALFDDIEVLLTSDVGIQQSVRSQSGRNSNDTRTKRVWSLWKTAKNAVSHRLHTRTCFQEKKNEDKTRRRRSQPVHRIGSGAERDPAPHGADGERESHLGLHATQGR